MKIDKSFKRIEIPCCTWREKINGHFYFGSARVTKTRESYLVLHSPSPSSEKLSNKDLPYTQALSFELDSFW